MCATTPTEFRPPMHLVKKSWHASPRKKTHYPFEVSNQHEE